VAAYLLALRSYGEPRVGGGAAHLVQVLAQNGVASVGLVGE